MDPNLISIANRLLPASGSPKTESGVVVEHNRLLHHQEIFNNQQRIGNTLTHQGTNCRSQEGKGKKGPQCTISLLGL